MLIMTESNIDTKNTLKNLLSSNNIWNESSLDQGNLEFENSLRNDNLQSLDFKDDNHQDCLSSKDLSDFQFLTKKRRRFTEISYGSSTNDTTNNFSFKNSENLQTKFSLAYLLGYNVDENSEIYDLFNQEVCFSSSMSKELEEKLKNINKIFESSEEIESYILEEIKNQYLIFSFNDENAKNTKTLHVITNSNLDPTNIYNEKLTKSNKPLHEKIIHLYTLEGFLFYSVNTILRQGSLLSATLNLYFVLLQVSIAIASKNYNKEISSNSLQTIEEQEYYILYRGAKISSKILDDYSQEYSKGITKFLVFNDFLSTSRNVDVAKFYVNGDNINKDLQRVLYTLLIPKSQADDNPNLMCFIEQISEFKDEFEVLFSSSTIFQVKSINKDIKNIDSNIEYSEVTLLFISNGLNKYDFIKYSKLKKIALKHIGDEGTKNIAEGLKINSNLEEIDLQYCEISKNGAKAIAECLKINKTLKDLNLNNNRIENEGARFIAESLKDNVSLTGIGLENNQISDEGGITLAEGIESNHKLIGIGLNNNIIGIVGAMALAKSLEVNKTLRSIGLNNNFIKNEGAMAFAESFKNNTSLRTIGLNNNQIGNDGSEAIIKSLQINKTMKWIELCNKEIEEDFKNLLGDQMIVKI